jgi:hypothetical protein
MVDGRISVMVATKWTSRYLLTFSDEESSMDAIAYENWLKEHASSLNDE